MRPDSSKFWARNNRSAMARSDERPGGPTVGASALPAAPLLDRTGTAAVPGCVGPAVGIVSPGLISASLPLNAPGPEMAGGVIGISRVPSGTGWVVAAEGGTRANPLVSGAGGAWGTGPGIG